MTFAAIQEAADQGLQLMALDRPCELLGFSVEIPGTVAVLFPDSNDEAAVYPGQVRLRAAYDDSPTRWIP